MKFWPGGREVGHSHLLSVGKDLVGDLPILLSQNFAWAGPLGWHMPDFL
jgi:hypothetical protein